MLANKLAIFLLAGILLIFSCQKANAVDVAITVDDIPVGGPLPPDTTEMDIVNQMLAVFKKHHVEGVYGFVIGNKPNDNADLVKVLQTWVDNGQLLGNHTYSHLDLANVTSQEYIDDIKKNEPILAEIMGDKNYRYFRYPYLSEGNTQEKRNSVRQFLFANHYKIAEDTLDFFDYNWSNAYVRCKIKNDPEAIKWMQQSYLDQAVKALGVSRQESQALFHRDIKYVLLIHFRAFNALMLDKLLTAYEEKGVKFVPLTEALNDEAYELNPNFISSRGYIFLDQLRMAKGQTADNKLIIFDTTPIAKLESLCPLN